MKPTKIIGITGGVGAGKSSVLTYLQERYAVHLCEADKIGHDVMCKGTEAYGEIVNLFGSEILAVDGSIDRKILGQKVFQNTEELKKLNGIIHPAVKNQIRKEIQESREQKLSMVVIEAALLIEDHYEEICDEFWYLYTTEEIRRERLKKSRGYSDEKISAIFANQQSEESFRNHCQRVIENSEDFEKTKIQLDQILEEYEIEKETTT